MPAAPLIEFLKSIGTDRIPHSPNVTLLDHLIGTATILERWGCSERACKAGLFHSIYGTAYFKSAPLTYADRPKITPELGEAAERLAWIFCALDRRLLYEVAERGAPYRMKLIDEQGEVELTFDELLDLMAVMWANAVEQVPQIQKTDELLTSHRRALGRAKDLLPEVAVKELAAVYGDPIVPPRIEDVRPGLAALFNLPDAKPFLERHWPDNPFWAGGPVARLASFLYTDLRELLDLKVSFVQAFIRSLEGTHTSIYLQPQQIMPLYNAGFTIYFHSLSSPKFTPWMEALDRELGLAPGATRVSAFASRRGPGIRTHYDLNDNFVIQVKGMKRWRVARNRHVVHPTAGYTLGRDLQPVHQIEAPYGFPNDMPEDHQTIDFHPGTVMFMPRGFWHDCDTTEDESLHFNIQSGLATWRDLAAFFLREKLSLIAPPMRAGVSHLFEDGVLRADVRRELLQKLRGLIENVGDDDLKFSEAEFKSFIARVKATVQ